MAMAPDAKSEQKRKEQHPRTQTTQNETPQPNILILEHYIMTTNPLIPDGTIKTSQLTDSCFKVGG